MPSQLHVSGNVPSFERPPNITVCPDSGSYAVADNERGKGGFGIGRRGPTIGRGVVTRCGEWPKAGAVWLADSEVEPQAAERTIKASANPRRFIRHAFVRRRVIANEIMENAFCPAGALCSEAAVTEESVQEPKLAPVSDASC